MPIATFVTLGLEHSVANMFLLPLGAACGAVRTLEFMFACQSAPCGSLAVHDGRAKL